MGHVPIGLYRSQPVNEHPTPDLLVTSTTTFPLPTLPATSSYPHTRRGTWEANKTMADHGASKINHDNHLLLVRRRHRRLSSLWSIFLPNGPSNLDGPADKGCTSRTNPSSDFHTSYYARISDRRTIISSGIRMLSRTCSKRPPPTPSTRKHPNKMSSTTLTRCLLECAVSRGS